MKIAIVGRINGQDGSVHNNIADDIVDLALVAIKKGHEIVFADSTYNLFIDSFLPDDPDYRAFILGFVTFGGFSNLSQSADIVIVVGGDGTMLSTAKQMLDWGSVPIIGINLGNLGFITDVPRSYSHESLLDAIANWQGNLEERSVIATGQAKALNDIVISRRGGKILEFSVHVDNEHAFTAKGDGLIVSTPTGSTAYALSASGPIVHPSSKIIELVPLNPQTLSCRPLIVSDKSMITFKLISGEAEVFADGQQINASFDDVICITKHSQTVKLFHPNIQETKKSKRLVYSYFNTLREKLNWHHLPGTPRG